MKQTKKQLDRVQLTDTKVKLVMPEKVLHQIQYLCQQIPKVEWSGVLFYSVEGDITSPKDMVMTLEEILPMHKGTSGYTEYTLDERVLDFMMDNEIMEKGWKMGHIHSHNTMNVFFSGTDWGELDDNAPNHNYYLSLIVNNFMDFCAKVCFIAKSQDSKEFSFYANNGEGERYVYEKKNYKVEEEKLISYDCEIDTPLEVATVAEDFSSKVDGIIKSAERRALPHKPLHTIKGPVDTRRPTSASDYGGSWASRQKKGTETKAPNKTKEINQKYFKNFQEETFENQVNNHKNEINPKFLNLETEDREDLVETFALFVLNGGNSVEAFHDVEELLQYYQTFHTSGASIAKTVLEVYAAVYDQFFDGNSGKDKPEVFITITEEVIQEYELWAHMDSPKGGYFLLKPTIDGLQSMLAKFSVDA